MGEAVKKIDHVESSESGRLLDIIKQQQIVVEFSLEGEVYFSSSKFLESLGFEASDILDFKSHLNPEFAESESCVELWKALAEGESYSGEFSFLSKKGTSVWYAANFAPSFNAQGKVDKAIMIASDITVSKAELEARINIMNLTSIVSESDLKGNILTVNDKFVETSKYPRDELIGQPHNTTRHPDMPKEVFKEMWATIGRKKMFRGKIKNLAKDGSPYYVDAVISPLIGKNGRPYKYLGVRYDITVDETEKQVMQGVISAINTGFAFVEFDTKGNFITGNSNFYNTLGYSEEELAGKHHSLFCDPEYVKTDDYRNFWDDLANGQGRSGIYKRRDKSGEVLWLQGIYEPVKDETGRVLKVVKLVSNVTDQQNMLVAIKETAQELSQASSELTETAQVMTEASKKTSSESQSASSIASEVSNGVRIVATNIEEMVASIKEISRSTS
jgi:methyl-accepting chemotaxis protein